MVIWIFNIICLSGWQADTENHTFNLCVCCFSSSFEEFMKFIGKKTHKNYVSCGKKYPRARIESNRGQVLYSNIGTQNSRVKLNL